MGWGRGWGVGGTEVEGGGGGEERGELGGRGGGGGGGRRRRRRRRGAKIVFEIEHNMGMLLFTCYH